MENLLFLGVPILKHIRVLSTYLVLKWYEILTKVANLSKRAMRAWITHMSKQANGQSHHLNKPDCLTLWNYERHWLKSKNDLDLYCKPEQKCVHRTLMPLPSALSKTAPWKDIWTDGKVNPYIALCPRQARQQNYEPDIYRFHWSLCTNCKCGL